MSLTYAELRRIATGFPDDVARMQAAMKDIGRVVTDEELIEAWADYCASVCASWFSMGDDVNAWLPDLLKRLPADGRKTRWTTRAEAADDGTGDLILPLPADLVAQMGLKAGDELDIHCDDSGNLVLTLKSDNAGARGG